MSSADSKHFLQVVAFDTWINTGEIQRAKEIVSKLEIASPTNDLSDNVAFRLVVDCKSPNLASIVLSRIADEDGHLYEEKKWRRILLLKSFVGGNGFATTSPSLVSSLQSDHVAQMMIARLAEFRLEPDYGDSIK